MKHESLWVTAIIPAKTDSTRLTKKNLKVTNGKTLLEHTLDYAKKSKANISVVNSSSFAEFEGVAVGTTNYGYAIINDLEIVS